MKILKFKYPYVPVDAGMVCVGDIGWLRRQGGGQEADVDLPPGYYDIVLTVHGCWHGRVVRRGRMRLDKGAYVGDPGHGLWPVDTWSRLLKRTDCLRKLSKAAARRILVAGTGGDGGFRVTVTFKKVTL